MSKVRGNINVTLEGRGPLIIRPSDYVATGGEGSIYRAKNTVIKLYTDLRKMRRDGMAKKIELLSRLDHKFIVRPRGLVTLSSGEPAGYYMKFVNGEPLPRVFTNDFRKRKGFTDDHASVLVDHIHETVCFAHEKKAVLVDANEMNWLIVSKKSDDPEPRVIDVDSWSIGKWPAMVIMPSIRDWHTKGFNQLSDWFTWGIVTFQIYTGIHPYKGRMDGYKSNELEKRMKANASVFSQGVRLNRAVRDFSVIPGRLLDWYVGTFQNGKRIIPPSPFETGAVMAQMARVLHAVTTASGILVFDKIFGKVNDSVIRFFPCGVVLLNSGKLVEISKGREIGTTQSRDIEIIKVQNGWLRAEMKGWNVDFFYISEASLRESQVVLNIKGRRLVRYEDRLFIVIDQGLTEIVLKVLGKPVLSVGQTWGVMVNSTHWFDGIGIQDVMGATYIVAPFGSNSCVQIRVRELDGFKPIMGKAGNRFIIVTALDKSGVYRKFELTLDRSYSNYKMWQGIIDSPDLNISILPKGVCATIVNDGELDIFVPTTSTLNKIQDKGISTDMVLANWDNKVVYVQDGNVWSVRIK